MKKTKSKSKRYIRLANKYKRLFIVVAIGVIGSVLLLTTKASPFTTSFEPEANAPSDMIVSASTASGGRNIKFKDNKPQDTSKFTLAVVPDTQNEVGFPGNYSRFTNRWNWFINHRQALNLKFIFQVGDVNNWPGKICETSTKDPNCSGMTNPEQSSEGLKILENAGIPYAITPGNHDTAAVRADGKACQDTSGGYRATCPGTTASTQVRNISAWEKAYPKSRYPGLKTLCDEFNTYRDRLMTKGAPAGMSSSSLDHPQWMSNYCTTHNSTDNAYRTFTAGGLNWLAINYEFYPRQVVQEWMKIVIENHPHHNVILFSHMFLSNNSKSLSSSSTGYTAPQGVPKTVFDNVISKYPNVKFTFSGHTTGNNGCAKLTGVNGNTIYSYLNDRQDGYGNVSRLLEITPDIGNGKGQVNSKMYTHMYEKDNYPAQLDMSDFKNCSASDITWTR